ncbi:phosphatidylinositol-specific phospholipase C/glycerophosphodiester phosphodiesterase family protein [Streptomyces sp. NPDC051684]|uniref:phosphatidylinositol-specific phospholipase C/glycerophosphodiester phosphodiesterase family protein n=1 Tax=Streptomyces sp. NPDC051684 TaxID=3365670 RepID=UPI0037B3F66D
MAPTTRRRALGTLAAALAVGVTTPGLAQAAGHKRGPAPLRRAHAHNDYEHPRPLFDALDQRFNSVEADIYLVNGDLLVAHDPVDLDPTRTLASLYLDPLAARVRANHGSVYRGWRTPLQLLVDIKTDGAATYQELDRQLRRHGRLLTTYDRGRVHTGAVTVVVSGDRAARPPMEAQTRRSAFYDGRLADLGSAAPASFVPLISDNWANNFTWLGSGPMLAAERDKLRGIVGAAHKRGQRVRFWATPDVAGPERDAVWAELIAADVDHLNTDDLAGLRTFLEAHDKSSGR